MVSRSELGQAALELAAAGHPVLPLHSPEAGRCSCGNHRCSRVGKHPRGCYGLTHATTDLERIESWWWGQPEANVGLRCDGLVVFDLDGAKGRRSLVELESELGELPASRVQTSGRGEHRFYRIPGEGSISNSTVPLGSPPDLHLRAGDRGYVVAAPSLHENGTHYAWLEPEAPIADLPRPWLERMVGLQRRPEREPSTPLAGVRGPTGGRYGQAALEGELHKIRLAPEGARNETLNRSVFRLAQLAAGGELGLEVIEQEAKAAALAVGLPEREADLTIHYALAAGYRFPRARKPR
jgi:hypothetical protein